MVGGTSDDREDSGPGRSGAAVLARQDVPRGWSYCGGFSGLRVEQESFFKLVAGAADESASAGRSVAMSKGAGSLRARSDFSPFFPEYC